MARLLDAALWYASRGWPVFPLHTVNGGRCSCGSDECTRQGKHPRTEHGLLDATTDTLKIRGWWTRWPEANIGLATGAASGVVVLDIDGPGGEESVKGMDLGGAPVSTTGKGRHLFYRHPGREVRNFCRKRPGLDFRGDGGYVVVPPSVHYSGVTYTWGQRRVDPPELPGWIIELFREEERTVGGSIRVGAVVETIVEGERSAKLTSLAGTMRRRGMLKEAITEALLVENATKCVPPMKESEVRAIAASVSRYSPEEATEKRIEAIISECKPDSATAQIQDRWAKIDSGEYRCVPWSHETLTRATQALLPSSLTMITGGPGSAKSLFKMQEFRGWLEAGEKCEELVFERDMPFYVNRFLAQETGETGFTEVEWVKNNAVKRSEVLERLGEKLERLQKCWTIGKPGTPLSAVADWIEDKAKQGARLIGVDPITAAGQDKKNVWDSDFEFVMRCIDVSARYQTAIILVIHPSKGSLATLDTMAGGASYPRFNSCTLSIKKSADMKAATVRMNKVDFPGTQYNMVIGVEKSTMSWGQGCRFAFMFNDRGLTCREIGLIVKVAKEPKEQKERKDVD